MALFGDVHVNSGWACLMPVTALAGAQTLIPIAASATGATPKSGPITQVGGAKYLVCEAILVVAGGGTTAKAYVQTSLDQGATWFDVICFAFTNTTASKTAAISSGIAFAASAYAPLTPGNGALADNTCIQGIFGDRFRVSYVTTGTFTGASSLAVYAQVKG
jgi:hypothetical protein